MMAMRRAPKTSREKRLAETSEQAAELVTVAARAKKAGGPS